MKQLEKIYKDSDIGWFTPVELFKVNIVLVCLQGFFNHILMF